MVSRTVQCSRNVLHAVQPQSRVPCGVWQGKDMTAVVLQAENYARKVRALAAGGLRVPFSATRAHKHWHPHGKRKPESPVPPCVSRARPVSLPTVMRGAAMTSQLCEVELLCRRAKGDAGLGELGAPTAFDPSHPPAARHQSYTRRLISR